MGKIKKTIENIVAIGDQSFFIMDINDNGIMFWQKKSPDFQKEIKALKSDIMVYFSGFIISTERLIKSAKSFPFSKF